MSLTLVKVDGFFHCEGLDCKFKSKKISHLVYFKGKYLCFGCKLKVSQYINIPTSNPCESTLKRITYKDIGLDYKKIEKGKLPPKNSGSFRVKDDLRNWAYGNKITSVGLTKDEHSILWRHFYSQGLNDLDIKKNIDKVKESIKTSHEQFKQGLTKVKPTFKEEFNKLIEVKK